MSGQRSGRLNRNQQQLSPWGCGSPVCVHLPAPGRLGALGEYCGAACCRGAGNLQELQPDVHEHFSGSCSGRHYIQLPALLLLIIIIKKKIKKSALQIYIFQKACEICGKISSKHAFSPLNLIVQLFLYRNSAPFPLCTKPSRV